MIIIRKCTKIVYIKKDSAYSLFFTKIYILLFFRFIYQWVFLVILKYCILSFKHKRRCKIMTAINTDSIITTINAFIPIIIVMALLGAVMGALGKIRF